MVLVDQWMKYPERGDIIAFQIGDQIYIKRVVAVPGDMIRADEGQIYVNDTKLIETYPMQNTGTVHFNCVRVPENRVFVLGDDRDESFDSREMGTIPLDSVRGVVINK